MHHARHSARAAAARERSAAVRRALTTQVSAGAQLDATARRHSSPHGAARDAAGASRPQVEVRCARAPYRPRASTACKPARARCARVCPQTQHALAYDMAAQESTATEALSAVFGRLARERARHARQQQRMVRARSCERHPEGGWAVVPCMRHIQRLLGVCIAAWHCTALHCIEFW